MAVLAGLVLGVALVALDGFITKRMPVWVLLMPNWLFGQRWLKGLVRTSISFKREGLLGIYTLLTLGGSLLAFLALSALVSNLLATTLATIMLVVAARMVGDRVAKSFNKKSWTQKQPVL